MASLSTRDSAADYETQRVLEMVDQMQQDYAARDKLYRQIDECIYLEQEVYIPDAYKKSAVEVRSPLPLHAANQITSTLTINAPTILFDQVQLGDAGIENKSLRQSYFDASWERQQFEAGRRLFRAFGHAVTIYGMGILKTTERKKRAWAGYDAFSKKLWGDLNSDTDLSDDARSKVYDAKTEEFKRGAPYPIATTDVLPHTFYAWQGEDGFSICAEVKEVPYLDTLLRYDAALNGNGEVVPKHLGLPQAQWHQVLNRKRTIKMIEFWEWDKVTYVLQGPGDKKRRNGNKGYTVKTLKHKYGDQYLKTLVRGPYFVSDGITTSSRRLEHKSLGVLFAFLHLFPLLNSLLTMQSQSAFATAYPAYRRGQPDGFQAMADTPFGVDASQGEANTTQVIPGEILPFDVVPMDQPRSGVDLDKAIALTRSLIELAMPDAAMGQISPESSGYAVNQAAHLAKLAWTPIVDNMKIALARRVSFESWLIAKRIGEPLYVHGSHPARPVGNSARSMSKGWIRIRPDDLGDAHRYHVELNPETPSNELLNLRAIAQKLQMRLIAPSKAIELAGEDPYQVELAWLVDDLKKDQAIRQTLRNRSLKKVGTIDQQALMGTTPPNQQQGGGSAALPPGNVGGSQQQGGPTPQAAPLSQVSPGSGTPGVPSGAPGGIRNPPARHSALPGEQPSSQGPA